jgi:hypothetical protein
MIDFRGKAAIVTGGCSALSGAARSTQFPAVDGGLTVGPRQAWEESAAVESWSRIGLSEEAVKKLLGTAG